MALRILVVSIDVNGDEEFLRNKLLQFWNLRGFVRSVAPDFADAKSHPSKLDIVTLFQIITLNLSI